MIAGALEKMANQEREIELRCGARQQEQQEGIVSAATQPQEDRQTQREDGTDIQNGDGSESPAFCFHRYPHRFAPTNSFFGSTLQPLSDLYQART